MSSRLYDSVTRASMVVAFLAAFLMELYPGWREVLAGIGVASAIIALGAYIVRHYWGDDSSFEFHQILESKYERATPAAGIDEDRGDTDNFPSGDAAKGELIAHDDEATATRQIVENELIYRLAADLSVNTRYTTHEIEEIFLELFGEDREAYSKVKRSEPFSGIFSPDSPKVKRQQTRRKFYSESVMPYDRIAEAWG